HIRLKNLEVKNAVYSGILTSDRGTPNEGFDEIISCHIHNNGTRSNLDHGIYMNVPSMLVEYCDVHDNAAFGVQFDNGPTTNGIVRFNRIYNNSTVGNGGGVVVYGTSSSNHVIYNNLIYNNGGWGLICRSVGIKIYNNTFYGSGANSIYIWEENGGIVRNNIVYGTVSGSDIFLEGAVNTTI